MKFQVQYVGIHLDKPEVLTNHSQLAKARCIKRNKNLTLIGYAYVYIVFKRKYRNGVDEKGCGRWRSAWVTARPQWTDWLE